MASIGSDSETFKEPKIQRAANRDGEWHRRGREAADDEGRDGGETRRGRENRRKETRGLISA